MGLQMWEGYRAVRKREMLPEKQTQQILGDFNTPLSTINKTTR